MRRHRKHSLKGRLGGHTLVRHEIDSCRLTAMASSRTARIAEEQAGQEASIEGAKGRLGTWLASA